MRRTFALRLRTFPELLIRASLVAAVVGLWLMFLSPRAVGGPVGVVWVSGTSMEPALHTGDLVVTYERGAYEVDDIVAFEIPEGGTVIHRVDQVVDDGYRFRGDNRATADPWTLDERAIRGKQVLRIPNAAGILLTLSRPEIAAGLAAALVVLARSGALGAEPAPEPAGSAS